MHKTENPVDIKKERKKSSLRIAGKAAEQRNSGIDSHLFLL